MATVPSAPTLRSHPTERDYSPTTRYLDYAIGDDLFHWESQAQDTELSERGQYYINHADIGRSVVLLVRSTKQDSFRRTSPYFCAGTANYVSHQSERPIQITWRLDTLLPGDIFASYRAAVV